MTAFLCYPPQDWNSNAHFYPGPTPADWYQEAVAAHYYDAADIMAGTTMRMHRLRPVYIALQMSWTDAGGGEQHRCILQENAQTRDTTRNAGGDQAWTDSGGTLPFFDPKPDVAALPLSFKRAYMYLLKWLEHRGDLGVDAYADAALHELGAGNADYGLEGECFRMDAGGARLCNTFESIHNPDARCNSATGGPQSPSLWYQPRSDHDTYFKPPPVTPDVPAGANAWARYCDKQVLDHWSAASAATTGVSHGGAAAAGAGGGAAATAAGGTRGPRTATKRGRGTGRRAGKKARPGT